MSLFDVDTIDTPLSELKKSIIKNRIPINANIFITNKCNFKCLHCYVQSHKNQDDGALSVNQWKKILNILKNKGCLSITFSGGEVLSSLKFLEIYEYAYSMNFKISIITNLSLLNKKHIEIFSQKRPVCIIVSLYGGSNDTYKKFCGINNGWDLVSQNIVKLNKYNINIQIQTVLNTINFSELKQMKEFAELNSISFFAFRNITCETDGNIRPLQYQISPQQEIESFEIMKDAPAFLQSIQKNADMWTSGYKLCFAGLTNCYIDCQGNLFLCNHSSNDKYSILDYGFDEAWRNILKIRKSEIEVKNECGNCKNKEFCGRCSPTFVKMKQGIGYPFPDCKNIYIIKNYLMKRVNQNENYEQL